MLLVLINTKVIVIGIMPVPVAARSKA